MDGRGGDMVFEERFRGVNVGREVSGGERKYFGGMRT